MFSYIDIALCFLPEKLRALTYSLNILIPNSELKIDKHAKILPTINFLHPNSISACGDIR